MAACKIGNYIALVVFNNTFYILAKTFTVYCFNGNPRTHAIYQCTAFGEKLYIRTGLGSLFLWTCFGRYPANPYVLVIKIIRPGIAHPIGVGADMVIALFKRMG